MSYKVSHFCLWQLKECNMQNSLLVRPISRRLFTCIDLQVMCGQLMVAVVESFWQKQGKALLPFESLFRTIDYVQYSILPCTFTNIVIQCTTFLKGIYQVKRGLFTYFLRGGVVRINVYAEVACQVNEQKFHGLKRNLKYAGL